MESLCHSRVNSSLLVKQLAILFFKLTRDAKDRDVYSCPKAETGKQVSLIADSPPGTRETRRQQIGPLKREENRTVCLELPCWLNHHPDTGPQRTPWQLLPTTDPYSTVISKGWGLGGRLPEGAPEEEVDLRRKKKW